MSVHNSCTDAEDVFLAVF